jgi:hypothetical protein
MKRFLITLRRSEYTYDAVLTLAEDMIDALFNLQEYERKQLVAVILLSEDDE